MVSTVLLTLSTAIITLSYHLSSYGYELFNNKDRVLLGKDSYTMKEVRAILQAHGLTESGWFDRDLGELDLGGEKITTESEDSESTLSDEEFEMMIVALHAILMSVILIRN